MTHRLLLSNAGKETDDIAIKERKNKIKKLLGDQAKK